MSISKQCSSIVIADGELQFIYVYSDLNINCKFIFPTQFLRIFFGNDDSTGLRISRTFISGSRRRNREIGYSHPKDFFPITVDTSSGTVILEDVVLDELRYNREIKRTDSANIFVISVDPRPVTIRHDDTRVSLSESDRRPHSYFATNDTPVKLNVRDPANISEIVDDTTRTTRSISEIILGTWFSS